MPSRRSLILGAVLVAGGVLLGTLASGGTADPTSLRPEPAEPVRMDIRPATKTEVAGAQLRATPLKRAKRGKLTLKPFITQRAVRTPPGEGEFVGVGCPKGFVAISGGALTGFVNLLMSQSAPIHPRTGRYTPRTWWVAVTNARIADPFEELPWFPLVNCLNKINVRR
jgi:hypothetical protein